MAPRNFYLQLLLCSLPLAALANFELIDGPGSERPDLSCDESWAAWDDEGPPFFFICINDTEATAESESAYASGLESAILPLFRSCNLLLGVNDTRELDQTDGVLRLCVITSVPPPMWPCFDVLYFDESGRPVICATPPSDDENGFYLPLLILIYVTTSITIVSSAAILITYGLFKTLRTLPGLVIMNLALSFFLGDLLVQIRLSHQYHDIKSLESSAIGAGFFLARYVWMTLTGIEMCRSLYKGVRLDIGNERLSKYTQLLIYMLVGWGTPAILAIIMYAVEARSYKVSQAAEDWFGLRGYLTQYVPLALTQLINIAIVIFLSVIFLGAVRRQRRLNAGLKRQEVNFVRVFLILITVLGLVWIALFVLLRWRANNRVQIAFVIIVVPQPLLVCIAFICTKKVGYMYLDLLGIRRRRSRSSQRQNTLSSIYSDKELKRGKTVTSMLSERELSLSKQKDTKYLYTITEGDEKEEKWGKESSTAVSNEKDIFKSNGTDKLENNGDIKSNGFSNPEHSNFAPNSI